MNSTFVTTVNPYSSMPDFRPMAKPDDILTVQSRNGLTKMTVSAVYYLLNEDGSTDYAYSMIADGGYRRACAFEDGGRLTEFPLEAGEISRMSYNPIDEEAHELPHRNRLRRLFWRKLG